MADNKAQMTVDGDVSPLRQKLREAARDLKQFGDEGKSSVEGIGGPLKALQDKFVAIGAILAGGAVFKQAVTQAAEFAEESIKLGNALGISATEASTLISALEDIGVSQEEFISSSKGLLKEVKSNEEGLNAMGLKTRDAAGNLRPLNELMVDGIAVMNEYKAGTDRAIAGQALFGKGFDINGNLAKLNSETLRENAELQRALGLIVGQENVDAFNAYDQAMDQSGMTLKAMETTIGNALMPVLTKLGEWFVSVGPAAIVAIKGAIGGLVSVFWGLKMAVEFVWNAIAGGIEIITINALRMADALSHAFKLDFAGAKAAWERGGEMIGDTMKKRFENIVAAAEENRDRIWALFSEGAPAAAPGTGGKTAAGLVGNGDKGDKAAQKAAEKALADRIKAEEDAFKAAVKIAEDYEAQWDREYKAVAEAARKSAKDRMDVEMARADGVRNLEMLRLDELDAQARHELDMGAISQQEYLARLAQFNQARLQAEVDLIAAKIEAAKADPTTSPADLERLEQQLAEVRARYALQAADLARQQAAETESIWSQLGDRMSSLWDKGIQALMNGTLTWKNALQSVLAEVVGVFGNASKKMVGDWLADQARALAQQISLMAQKRVAEKSAASETISTKTAETSAVVGSDAAQAATGAAKSQAGIPYVGPVLAIAAMAAMFAAVSAMGKRKSAMGGYDIPKGVNPLTQLHEEEMVLPKQFANVIRGMAGEGGGSGGPAQVNNKIVNVLDPRDMAGALGSTREFERAVLNVIQLNPSAM